MGKSKIVKRKNEIIVPSSLEYLAKVDEYLEEKLRKAGWQENQIADVAISLSEALTNAIVHGNKSDPKKKVSIQVELKPDKAIICVTDQGKGFNHSCIRNPVKKENLLKEKGRGIFILRSLMDQVEIENKANYGCCLTMIKKAPKKK
jgi:serine/threonine-protein kinase RsbW